MEVRDSYYREFLRSLRESPAWEALIKAMLKEMVFIQDEVSFVMGNYPESFPIHSKMIEGNPLILEGGTVYTVHMDGTYMIKVDGAAVCTTEDGLFLSSAEITDIFYIKPLSTRGLQEFIVRLYEFYPNSLRGKGLKRYLQEEGFYQDYVTFSSFGDILSPTSPYHTRNLMDALEPGSTFNYNFSIGGMETKGSRNMVVRKGAIIYKISELQYRYRATWELLPGKDILTDSKGKTAHILSANKDTLTVDSPLTQGVVTVKRTQYIVPLAKLGGLKSELEFEFTTLESDVLDRFTTRVTPFRCRQGFKGTIDKVNHSLMTLKDNASRAYPANDIVTFGSEASLDENLVIRVNTADVLEGDIRLLDTCLSKKEFSQLLLK